MSPELKELLTGKYVKLAVLTLGLAALFYILLWLIFEMLGIGDLPQFVLGIISLFSAGLLVAKFVAFRLA